MRVLLVLFMIMGTSSVFAKGKSHNKRVVEVVKKYPRQHRDYGRDSRRSDRGQRISYDRKHFGHGRYQRKYHRYPKRIVRYERPRIVVWPRFSVLFRL